MPHRNQLPTPASTPKARQWSNSEEPKDGREKEQAKMEKDELPGVEMNCSNAENGFLDNEKLVEKEEISERHELRG